MTNLLRLGACLFLCVSLNSNADFIRVDWSGYLESVVIGDPENHPELALGKKYSGTTLYPNQFHENTFGFSFSGNDNSSTFYSFFSGQSSVDIDNGNLQFDSSSLTAVGIFDGITCGNSGQSWDALFSCEAYSQIDANHAPGTPYDGWLVLGRFDGLGFEHQIIIESNNDLVFSDTSFISMPPNEIIDGNETLKTFWIYKADYDSGWSNPPIIFGGWGYLDEITISQVPLPAGIYLFLSGLVGLGLMRGRNA